MEPKVSIIILNYNGWQDTLGCLESLHQIDYKNYDVILVDNESYDASISKIKDYCEEKIKVQSKFFKYKPENKPIKITEFRKEEIENCAIDENFKDLPPNRKLILIKNDKNYGFTE